MTNYVIVALGGQYLRETMQAATHHDVESTLVTAMSYLGYPDAVIEHLGTEVYAYADAATARDAESDYNVRPVLVAKNKS